VSRHLVLDASAAIEAVLRRPRAGDVLRLLEEAVSVRAPDLFVAEAGNALWKHVRVGDLGAEDADDAIRCAIDLVDTFIPSQELVIEALATARAHDHPVYDALYAISARRSGAAVCTLDRRLVRLLGAMDVPCGLTPSIDTGA
jgi:predicted nucleic acid-binding protein